MMLVLMMSASLSISSCSEDDEGGMTPNKKKPNTNGHAYVDLGLPSGILWATMNIGSNTPEGYGWYLAWGETKPKGYYDWDTYFDPEYNKYSTTKKSTLYPEDDAAHVNWGGDWRMPTRAEQDELRSAANCFWTWIMQNGVYGYKVTSNRNGKSIFLPAAGARSEGGLVDVGSSGRYWSSSLHTSLSFDAYYLYFRSDDVDWDYGTRDYGRPVRAVCPQAGGLRKASSPLHN